ncbi:MAG: TIGR03936 family radical SAM-associated protein [Dehalobacterium sp.]
MFLRSCFSVKGNIKFLSHLDLLKVMERAMRRAQIPVAFSQGFNPHPKMAFGTAKSVGLASECEYFDVELDREMAPRDFKKKLQEKCPMGIEIKETKEISPEEPALMAVINCASYQVTVKVSQELSQEELDKKIADLFSRSEIIVQRVSPKRKKEFDIRPGIISLTYRLSQPEKILFEMDLNMGNQGNVKPGEVIGALGLGDYEILEILRTGLFIRRESGEKVYLS